jgi:hypothetical protein
LANESLSGLTSITLTKQAVNPGSANTLWIDSTTQNKMLGDQNLHKIGEDVSGPGKSTDNAIARWDNWGPN